MSEALRAAAAAVIIPDVAGRIAASPERQASRATPAEVLALAWAAEGLTAVVIEAQLLVRALELPITGGDANDAARDHAIQTQMGILNNQFAALFGEKGA
ncbi:hypothetical protein [Mesorhizobium sp. 1M-11]|uniref:hypothetical protein n=1 Tax=Mesorhizobium sp. 1M-11 TaxID=1529006 RepID=UPI0006C745B3|nr:hypothetical protein [Mesorhizobium sp. 1M-11]